MVIRPTSHVVVEPAKGGRSCWLEDVRVPGTPHDRRIVAGVDVDQLTRLPVERDEGCGGKPVAWGVPDQMPVDLRRQRRHVRCYRRQAPHQRLNLAANSAAAMPLPGCSVRMATIGSRQSLGRRKTIEEENHGRSARDDSE
jgi:hypothetical protein